MTNQEILNKRFMWASNLGLIEIVKLVLDLGADVHGEEALIHASYYGHTEVVKLLLENGVDVHAENDKALRWATRKGNTKVVKLLKKYMEK
jgi:ankyrin repeat protein